MSNKKHTGNERICYFTCDTLRLPDGEQRSTVTDHHACSISETDNLVAHGSQLDNREQVASARSPGLLKGVGLGHDLPDFSCLQVLCNLC